jgi:hypothetical protein
MAPSNPTFSIEEFFFLKPKGAEDAFFPSSLNEWGNKVSFAPPNVANGEELPPPREDLTAVNAPTETNAKAPKASVFRFSNTFAMREDDVFFVFWTSSSRLDSNNNASRSLCLFVFV